MSILIKDMKMPESCASCDIACRLYLDFGADGLLSKICRTESRRPDCPLVSVSPHGDLIDRDALMDSDGDLWDGMWGWSGVKIMNAPTIIPAEEDE